MKNISQVLALPISCSIIHNVEVPRGTAKKHCQPDFPNGPMTFDINQCGTTLSDGPYSDIIAERDHMHVITLIQTEGGDTRGLPHWLFHSSVPWENNPILGKTSRAAGSKAAWLHAVSGVMERPSLPPPHTPCTHVHAHMYIHPTYIHT